MIKNQLELVAHNFLRNSPQNYISEEVALSKECVGMQIYDMPIFEFGLAGDLYFEKLKKPQAIGEHFIMPSEWLNCAKTVISYFLPFTKQVIQSNKKDFLWPSYQWLNARIDGQKMMDLFTLFVREYLKNAGFEAVAPSIDSRFKAGAITIKNGQEVKNSFTSNWSERHVAFVCGLGTFSLSKGLITRKGMAGRFGSVITDMVSVEYTKREYNDIYEYCSKCGACIKNCPVNAISLEKGKDHVICNNFLKEVVEKHRPYYGCGKCQVKVPCESRIPINKVKY